MKRKNFSPWPLAIVTLLVGNAALAFFALYMSRSDGGAQVVPDYYARAVAWDSLAAVQRATAASGWRLVVLDPDAHDSLAFEVRDAGGRRVDGLSGDISIRRPFLSEPLLTTDVDEALVVDSSPIGGFGLFDAEANLTDGERDFRFLTRFERSRDPHDGR